MPKVVSRIRECRRWREGRLAVEYVDCRIDELKFRVELLVGGVEHIRNEGHSVQVAVVDDVVVLVCQLDVGLVCGVVGD